MRILERYILASVLTIFLTCFGVFFFMYIVIDLFAHLDEILKHSIGLDLLKQYYLAYIPIILTQVAPFSCMLATLYTFARMNRDNEIVAIRSSGQSIFQISRPVILFGLMLSLMIFWINDKIVPRATLLSQEIKEQIENEGRKVRAPRPEVIDNLTIYGLRNRLFVISRFHPAQNLMEGITILEHDERQNILRKIWAEKGEFREGKWIFYRSFTYSFDANGQISQEPQFFDEEMMTFTEKPADFLTQQQQPELMSIAQLQEYIWRLSRSGATAVIRRFTIDLYQRFLSPFTSLLIILLSIPCALRVHRRAAGLSSLGLALALGFLYYILNAVSIALGNAGYLPAFAAASLVHVCVLGASLFLIATLP